MNKLTNWLRDNYDNNIISIEFFEWDTREDRFIFNLKVKDSDGEILIIDDQQGKSEIYEIIIDHTIEVSITY